MTANARSYPHPVLGNGDDLAGIFDVEFKYELEKENITLTPFFKLENEGIKKLLKDEAASFVIEVQCRSTFFRKSFTARSNRANFIIPSNLVRELVTVNFYVCADENIPGYQPSALHPDYGEASFDVEVGDILAVGGSCSFIAAKDFDPLRPPVASFMTIVPGSRNEGVMELDYDSEKITIILSQQDWSYYLNNRGKKLAEAILHASIVFPVLMDAIYKALYEKENYEGKVWLGRLEAILDAKGLRGKAPFETAQSILESPITRNFQSIESLLNEPDDNRND